MKPQVSKFPQKTFFLLGLISLVSAILLFSNLNSQYLWQDEAETALLGINILETGLPVAFNGSELISQEWGKDFDNNYLWRWTPWLDKYIAAVSMALFGKNTFAARFLFTLIGLLNIPAVFFVSRQLFKDDNLSLLCAAFLAVSVPFILFMRQCRYYSILSLSSLLLIYFFFGIVQKRRYSITGYVISAIVIFHSNYTTYVTAVLALSAVLLVLYREKKIIIDFITGNIITICFNLPGIILYRIVEKGETERLCSFFNNLANYEESVRYFVFSYPLFALYIGYLATVKLSNNKLPCQKETISIFIFCFFSILITSFLPWNFFRYIVHLIPLFMILNAYMLLAIIRSRKPWLIASLLLVGALHFFHPQIIWSRHHPYTNMPFKHQGFAYLHEITHDYNGPLEKSIRYLNSNARKGESIFVSYGDLVVSFYTQLRVFGGQSGIDISQENPPDWVLLRSFFSFSDRSISHQTKNKYIKTLKHWEKSCTYERVKSLHIPELFWENRPDPMFHMFKTIDKPLKLGYVKLYKKKKSSP